MACNFRSFLDDWIMCVRPWVHQWSDARWSIAHTLVNLAIHRQRLCMWGMLTLVFNRSSVRISTGFRKVNATAHLFLKSQSLGSQISRKLLHHEIVLYTCSTVYMLAAFIACMTKMAQRYWKWSSSLQNVKDYITIPHGSLEWPHWH